MRNANEKELRVAMSLRRVREAEAKYGMYPLATLTHVVKVKRSLRRDALLKGHCTWLDRVINDGGDIFTTTYSMRPTYPLRLCLEQLSSDCWSRFLEEQQRAIGEVVDAVEAVALEYNAYIGFSKLNEDEDEPGTGNRGYDWWDDSSILSTLEHYGDDWPVKTLHGEQPFSWQDVCRLAELVAIDYAVYELENRHTSKTATWLYRATELYDAARSYETDDRSALAARDNEHP